MSRPDYSSETFVAGRAFCLHGVSYAIGDPVDVYGVSRHRLRQMVDSRHLKIVERPEPATETIAEAVDPSAEPEKARTSVRSRKESAA